MFPKILDKTISFESTSLFLNTKSNFVGLKYNCHLFSKYREVLQDLRDTYLSMLFELCYSLNDKSGLFIEYQLWAIMNIYNIGLELYRFNP